MKIHHQLYTCCLLVDKRCKNTSASLYPQIGKLKKNPASYSIADILGVQLVANFQFRSKYQNIKSLGRSYKRVL